MPFGWNLIAMPTAPSPQSVEWHIVDVDGLNVSPFTGTQQIYDWRCGFLGVTVTMPPMPHAQARPWIAWLMAMRGRTNVCQLGDVKAAEPQGVASGSPLVSVAGQAGFLLQTTGWTPNTANMLCAGDTIQVGYRLYFVTADANSAADGSMLVNIWPNLRESPDINTPVQAWGSRGLWRLRNNTRTSSESPDREDGLYGIHFDLMEAF
jgi:hypothetical protein